MIGGRRIKGSGNKWYAPGDSSNEMFLCESKQTDKKSYSISKNKLEKIYNEALFMYKIPLFSIKIQNMDIVVLFKEDFEGILKQIKAS